MAASVYKVCKYGEIREKTVAVNGVNSNKTPYCVAIRRLKLVVVPTSDAYNIGKAGKEELEWKRYGT